MFKIKLVLSLDCHVLHCGHYRQTQNIMTCLMILLCIFPIREAVQYRSIMKALQNMKHKLAMFNTGHCILILFITNFINIIRSCLTQLLATINDWFKELDTKTPVDAIYWDLQKAFVKVPHKRLIKILHGYGMCGNLLLWINDFLDARSKYVCINGVKASKVRVISGVPQGSVLWPIVNYAT